MEDQNLHKELFEEPEIKPELPAKKLARSGNDVMIAGVCAGIADYFNWDRGTVRVAFILSMLFGNWPVVFYMVITFLLPINRSAAKLSTEEIGIINRANFKTVLSGVLMLFGIHFTLNQLGFHNSSSILEFPAGLTFPIAAIAAGVFLLSSKFSNGANELSFPANIALLQKRKMILGVCKGLSEYLIVDVVSIRIVFIMLSVFSLGLFAIAYVIFGLLFINKNIPSENE